jgi:phi13 family phage major tail protein
MSDVEYRGVDNLVYAKITQDDLEAYVTGEVKRLAAVAEISKTTESSSEAHYYDNAPKIVINSSGSDEITCTVSAIPLDVLADITGQYYDEELGVLIEGTRKLEYFALGYIAKKTDGSEVYVWRLKGTFGVPDSTHATENDGTDANGQEVTFTGVQTTHRFAKTGESCAAINADTSAGNVDVSKFFDTVTTPDTLKAKA